MMKINSSTNSFDLIKESSNCLFSKDSKIWQYTSWEPLLQLHQNIDAVIPQLIQFTDQLASTHWDGFMIEIKIESDSVFQLAALTNRLLRIVSEKDPTGINCMTMPIENENWRFTFNSQIFHILTFASCYHKHHPRNNYGTRHTYFLFQPSQAFARRHDHTGLIPTVIKDKIRKKFREAGMPYCIELSSSEYSAHKFVKPLNINDNIVRWWELSFAT